jgi:hypothetical protein
VRVAGRVAAYATRLPESGVFAEVMRPIQPTQLLDADASLVDVITALTRHDQCFVRLHGEVVAYVGREELQGPVARMWLFGIITSFELAMTEMIRSLGNEQEWTAMLTPARLQKAKALQEARAALGRSAPLLDCLQLSDKLRIVQEVEAQPRAIFRGNSKAESQRRARDFEDLRNGLAHAQDIISHDWTQIARLARRVEELANDSAG